MDSYMYAIVYASYFFFFQAEDGIRDYKVTGVQTCALPIFFYRFYRERFDQAAEFGFTGMTHRAAQPWEAGLFDGDENVILDFKFSNSAKEIGRASCRERV